MTAPSAQAAGWAPSHPVEIVVPAGAGGGADRMARLIQEIVSRHKLMAQPITVVNRAGAIGAEGYLALKAARGDAHLLIVTLSNLFTTPLVTEARFGWRELTPVAMLALDEFVLWVHADTPYRTASQYLDAVKAAGPNRFRMGGTGSKQEDQILTVAIEKAHGVKFIYLPFKGGGDVAAQLVARRIDSSVNNPIEALSYWRSGKLRPLCVFDVQRMQYRTKVAGGLSWNDVPRCVEAGVNVDYDMMRGIFMPAMVTREQVDFYIGLFGKVKQTPEWQAYMAEGALHPVFMTGAPFVKWLQEAEARHRSLLTEAGLIAAYSQ